MNSPTKSKSAIGLIGLAIMGENLARNIANKGSKISVFNRTTEKTEKFIGKFGSSLIHGTYTLKEFISSLETPRKIILLVKAGQAVDDMITQLSPLLDKKDIIIDCGNSHFKDTEKRQLELAKRGLNLVGCGISGGEEGALHGPSLMPGGNKESWEKIRPIFEKIAAKDFSGKPCVTHIGPGGSGHFVKMVHNGIEYAIMQLIAESYDILKNIGKFDNLELAKIFSNYNKNENLKSFLIEITAKIFTKKDPENSKKFIIDFIKDSAGQKGTGKWTTEAAHDLGAAIPTINAAVDARIISGDPLRTSDIFLKKNLPKTLSKIAKKTLIKELQNALELATIIAYLQGFQLITKANKEIKWNLDSSEIARIWQGGCIIRSDFLLKMESTTGNNLPKAKKTKQEILQNLNSKKQLDLRKIINLSIQHGIPISAFSSTLNYLDSYAKARLPQNLIQAQRDFFGAHGYERTDKPGSFHTEW